MSEHRGPEVSADLPLDEDRPPRQRNEHVASSPTNTFLLTLSPLLHCPLLLFFPRRGQSTALPLRAEPLEPGAVCGQHTMPPTPGDTRVSSPTRPQHPPFLHAHLPPRVVSIPVCLRLSTGNLFIFPAPPTTSMLFPPRTIPLFSMRYGVSWGGDSSSTGTTAQRSRGLWCVCLWSRCCYCSPIWQNSALFSLLFNAFPSALPLPHPVFPPRRHHGGILYYGYSDGFLRS